MNNILLIIIFLLGLVVGSFINVIIYRLKNGGDIFFDRSKCPNCKKKLGVFELIPILSFIFSKGRCRHCNKKISIQYPLVEFITALFFVFTFLNNSFLSDNLSFLEKNSINIFFFYSFLFSCLIAILVYDLKYYLIPDSIVFLALTLSIIYISVLVFLSGNILLIISNIAGALIYSGFFFFQYILSKGVWVGGGDIKLGLLLGFVLGWKLSILSLILAYVAGAFIAVALIGLKKKTRKDILPFGPFLIGSTILALFYGEIIINWYLNSLIY